MNLVELADYLGIIFDKEKNDTSEKMPTFHLTNYGNEVNIEYPNGQLLIELFRSISNGSPLSVAFVSYLENKATNAEEIIRALDYFIGTAQLSLYALVKLGYVNEAFSALSKRKSGFELIHRLLIQMVMEKAFDLPQLKDLSEIIVEETIKKGSSISMVVDGLKQKINESKYDLLVTKIKRNNLEINQDKSSVTEKIGRFGLDNKYSGLLDDIDQFINSTSNCINAGMINNLRTFVGDLSKDIAKRITEKEQSVVPMIDGKGEMGSVRDFLKEKLELSDKDNKFITSFVDVLHSEGGHSFTSEKEYFRLAKNIAIEIALFILTKYEKKYG